MHARGSGGAGHVESIVDQNACAIFSRSRLASLDCRARKIHQLSRRQVFLADLNPIDPRADRILDAR